MTSVKIVGPLCYGESLCSESLCELLESESDWSELLSLLSPGSVFICEESDPLSFSGGLACSGGLLSGG